MCMISMVMDHYQPLIPKIEPLPQQGGWTFAPTINVDELRKLIEDFNAAVAAARTIDKLTGQPDCEDPEKIKLVERVAELEIRLALSALPDASRQRVLGSLGAAPTGGPAK